MAIFSKVIVKDLAFMLSPLLLYAIPALSSGGFALPLAALSPLLMVIVLRLGNWKLDFNFKAYGVIYLYAFSQVHFFITQNFVQGIVALPVLVFFLHAMVDYGKTDNLSALNRLAKQFMVGTLILFICGLFLPLLSKFSFTPGSWYFIASKEIPIIQTTMDGPFLTIILATFMLLMLKDNKKLTARSMLYLCLIAFCFYIFVVFNRRAIILMFMGMIPFIFMNYFKKNKMAVILLAATFLVPLNFLLILKYFKEFLSIPAVQDVLLRSKDLDEDNTRLTGWIMALSAFQDISIEDFFGFRYTLVRADDERYNHFHNSFIQMYYEQGIFGIIITLIFLIKIIRRIHYFKYLEFKTNRMLFIFPIVFIILLLLTITEDVFRKICVLNVYFLIVGFFIIKTSEVVKKELKKHQGDKSPVPTLEDNHNITEAQIEQQA